MAILRIKPAQAFKTYLATYVELRSAIITVMAVLALAYVMNLSGQTASLGLWLAGTGGLFAILSPILGLDRRRRHRAPTPRRTRSSAPSRCRRRPRRASTRC